MTIGRTYRMIARVGRQDELAHALAGLRAAVEGMPGCEGVEVFRDRSDAARFLLIEKWGSIAHHEQALAALPHEAIAAVMGMLEAPPEAAYEELI